MATWPTRPFPCQRNALNAKAQTLPTSESNQTSLVAAGPAQTIIGAAYTLPDDLYGVGMPKHIMCHPAQQNAPGEPTRSP